MACCRTCPVWGLTSPPHAPQSGVLEKYGVELIGAKLPSIDRAEDRLLFKNAMTKIGLKTPDSGTAETWDEAIKVRPSACASLRQSNGVSGHLMLSTCHFQASKPLSCSFGSIVCSSLLAL